MLINPFNQKIKKIFSIDASLRYLSWFQNGERLLFMAERVGEEYNTEYDQTLIQSLCTNDGSIDTVIEFSELQQFLAPVLSNDGLKIAFACDVDNPIFNFMPSICMLSSSIINANQQDITRLTYELKLFSPHWSEDDLLIYILRDHGAYRQIYTVNAANGVITQITHLPENIKEYSLSPDGMNLAWVSQNAHDTHFIRTALNTGENTRDLVKILDLSVDTALGEVREIEWKIPNYPALMRSLLFLPLNYDKNKCYPLIVDIHGGGPGAHMYFGAAISVNSSLEWQLWTKKGYVVFVPEFRSSASFGSLAITRDEIQEHDLINCDVQDILAGVDSLVEQGIVDNNRMAVIGHSAGARRVNWLIVSTQRFKVAVSKEGWADEWFMLGTQARNRIYTLYGGHPAVVPENYQKNSSLFHATKCTTPTLFLMGTPRLGGIDQHDTVRWLFSALKSQNIDTQYILYPDEGHLFNRKENLLDAWSRTVEWIDRYL